MFGCGGVGLSAIMADAVAGATTVIGVDTRPDRLEPARELGATHTVAAGSEDAAARLASLTGHGAHYSLETTAHSKALALAVDCVSPRCALGLGARRPPPERD
ncbi:zinc-binding dehydrogenase [Streptomyces sp. NPDC001604]|uniref:zinc-binding dehydrogenase n=1 Tax=Streptomyces sp. NPDC001604 TaxID=3364593 RepID=UPI00368910F7